MSDTGEIIIALIASLTALAVFGIPLVRLVRALFAAVKGEQP